MAKVEIPQEESRVWELIKQFPDELGFVLQEENYEAYKDTFFEKADIILTEEDFNLIKNFFIKLGYTE